jgi:3-oxoacyl-[acyl-carrier protein] reductase
MHGGQCILITGTSQGLGKLLALAYLEGGTRVIGCSRGAGTITSENYFHYSLDITNEIAVREMFLDMRNKGLLLRTLINNAGISHNKLIALTSLKEARKIIDVNFFGAFILMKEALKAMQSSGCGRIINILSINLALSSLGASVYNSSKAALESFGKTAAKEYKTFNITINNLGLSIVGGTGMQASLGDRATIEKQNFLIKPNLLTVEEIKNAIDFFNLNASKNITGQTLYFGGV